MTGGRPGDVDAMNKRSSLVAAALLFVAVTQR
jgi:hypothetical protein